MKPVAIFDMDGLMFDTEAVYKIGWTTVAKQYGYRPSDQLIEEVRGTSGKKTDEIIATYLPGIDVDAYHNDVRAFVRSQLDIHVPKKEGLDELLSFFKEHNVKIAIASGSKKENIIKNLRNTQLLEYFDVIVSGHDVKHGKPAPDIYLEVCSQLGIQSNDAYVFEDGIHGVEAGLQAGCTTVMVIDLAKPKPSFYQSCAGIYDSLSEVLVDIKNGSL